jgi:hypothetical protein
MPAICTKTSGDIFGKRHIGIAIKRDAVAIVQIGELA